MVLSDKQLQKIISVLFLANKKIISVYQDKDLDVKIKDNNTPLTLADTLSHELIYEEFSKIFKGIPILSEESKIVSYQERKSWEFFWLVDPLDGTKEFIEKNGQFCVNIALIKKDKPVAGFISVPVEGLIYYAVEGLGAFIINKYNLKHKLRTRAFTGNKTFVIRSRSHPQESEQLIVDKLEDVQIVHVGSSLKFCLLAKGRADVYLRAGPTMEWDTASGQAIVQEAGGYMRRLDQGVLRYNKEVLKNPGFFCAANKQIFDMICSILKTNPIIYEP